MTAYQRPARSAHARHHIFRFHTQTEEQLAYLSGRLTLTKTAVVRLAIARLYEAERRREVG